LTRDIELVGEETTAIHIAQVQGGRAAALLATLAAFFRVEMVVTRDPGNDFAFLGDSQAL